MSEVFRLRGEELEWREVEENVLALDLRRHEYLAVNESGRELWKALQDGATMAQLAQVLVDGYGLEPETAERDAGEFVKELEAIDLVARGPGS